MIFETKHVRLPRVELAQGCHHTSATISSYIKVDLKTIDIYNYEICAIIIIDNFHNILILHQKVANLIYIYIVCEPPRRLGAPRLRGMRRGPIAAGSDTRGFKS